MQIGALHQTRFEHTSIWRALFHDATTITLPQIVEVPRPARPRLLPGPTNHVTTDALDPQNTKQEQ
jgi:hypothetical protein